MLGLLSALGGALGAPVTLKLRDLATADSGFLRFLVPQLFEPSGVTETYRLLKAACGSPAGPGDGVLRIPKAAREVYRPHRRAVLRAVAFGQRVSGRLRYRSQEVGMFPLDRIMSRPVQLGTIQHACIVQAEYDSSDVVGLH